MTRKHRIRIWIIIAIICVMSFSDRSFAEGTVNEDIKVLWRSLNIIVGRLSWLWIIFAKIAWELLTNKWVYWGAIWLDVLLRKYRNVVKNFANFWLWFYFVYVVFRWLISTWKDSIEKTLKNTLLWLLIAWVWIQASWFLTAALIDLSTIAVSAAWSFPSVIMSNSPYIESEVKKSISDTFANGWNQATKPICVNAGEGQKKWQYVDFICENTKIVELEKPKDMTELVDVLQPKPEDVSWPLYHIWFSILKIKNITTINSSESWVKATLFNTLIQWWTTIIYGIEMVVLCIAAIMRILYLWMFIMISPIAILLRCIKESWEKIWWNSKGFLSKFMTQLNFETLLVNVFKPAIVVLWLWVAAIFAWLMSNIIANSSEKSFTYQWITYSSKENLQGNQDQEGDTTYTTTMDHNLFNITLLNAWKTFLELVLAILTVILVYQIIKVAMTMWSWDDFVWKRIKSMQESVWKVLWSTPIIPVTTYDKELAKVTRYIWASSVFGLWGEESLLDGKIRWYQNEVNRMNNEDANIIKSWFTEDTPWTLSAKETTEIQNIMRDRDTPQDNLREAKEKIKQRNADTKGKWKWMTLMEDSVWRKEFEGWLNLIKEGNTDTNLVIRAMGLSNENTNGQRWEKMINRWKNPENEDRTLENMFNVDNKLTENAKAYAAFFLGDGDLRIQNILRREDLMNLDISKENTGDEEKWGNEEKSWATTAEWGDNPSSGTSTATPPTTWT